MALMKLQGELPEGAVFLTETEAAEHQWNLIWKWKPQSDIMPIRYGHMVTGVLCSMAGFYFNNHYRRKLKLQSFGRFSSYLPIVVFPAALGAFTHQQLVTTDILLHKTSCFMCIEMRAVALQTFIGFVYPLVLSPLAAFMNANNYLTYDVPSLTKSPGKVLALFWKMTKPISSRLSIIIAIQALAASLVTHQEAKSFYNLETRLVKMEKEAEHLHKFS